MKRFLLLGLCLLISLVGFAQSERVVRGVVMDINDAPLVDATIKAVSSSETMKTGPGGMFTMTVSPFVKFIEASYEGYISMQAEIDGSYLIFRLREDRKYWDNKAKAEAAAKAAEEEARVAEQKRIEAERLEAERLAAEKAKAEEAARIAEEKRLAAEKAAAEKAAAEKAKAEEAARLAEQKRLEQERIAEAKRLAAEKAAAEKAAAEKAKAEEAARLAEQKRLEQERIAEAKRLAAEKAAAEKAAAEKAKAEEAARLAEQKRLEQERIVEGKRMASENAVAKKATAELAKRIKHDNIKEKTKGYNSYFEVTYSLTERQDWLGLNYIGGYKFNNRLFLGVGVGANVAYEWRKMNPIPKGRLVKTVPNYSIPAFVHFRANFLKGKCSPLFALSAGVRYAPNQELPLELGTIKYNTFGMMANPQLGVNFRVAKNCGVYLTAGYECFMAHALVRNTGYSATLKSQLYSNFTFNLGVNF